MTILGTKNGRNPTIPLIYDFVVISFHLYLGLDEKIYLHAFVIHILVWPFVQSDQRFLVIH